MRRNIGPAAAGPAGPAATALRSINSYTVLLYAILQHYDIVCEALVLR